MLSATQADLKFPAISRIYREWPKKEKISSEHQFSAQKYLIDVRGEWPDYFKVIGTQLKVTDVVVNTFAWQVKSGFDSS